MTQEDQIHSHLVLHGEISSWEAIQKYRITRLSAYILNLRNMGVDIEDKWDSNKKGNRWKVYFLRKEDNKYNGK